MYKLLSSSNIFKQNQQVLFNLRTTCILSNQKYSLTQLCSYSNNKIINSNNNTIPSVHQNISGRKRFYKNVDVVSISNNNVDEFHITLDGRILKTPARNSLALPNKDLAMAIALEWDAQTDQRHGIQPVNMPLMSIASTALDQIIIDPNVTLQNCIKYLPTDSALFISPEYDRILLNKQKKIFSPLLTWYQNEFEITLQTTESMAYKIIHPIETIQKLENIIRKMDHFTLACLQGATLECKSILLAIAFIARHFNMNELIEASRLEEEFQLEIWGVVEGGHDMDRLNNAVRLSSVGTFMHLYKNDLALKTMWQELKQ